MGQYTEALESLKEASDAHAIALQKLQDIGRTTDVSSVLVSIECIPSKLKPARHLLESHARKETVAHEAATGEPTKRI